jgi:hypothetical protein
LAGLEDPKKPKERAGAAGHVAIILAIGIAVALNVITGALLWTAVVHLNVDPDSPGLSDNGVQILLAWGGGIISVLAGYVGYVVGKRSNGHDTPELKPEEPAP